MAKITHNCDYIKNASKINTNISILPYKTAILHGAINIIRDYKKKTEDGIDYKELCEQISKYVNSQKKCVRQELIEKGKKLTTNEWKTVIISLLVTFNTHDINSLCYLENDNEVSKKKEVLNIHDLFGKFCIDKKIRLQSASDMDFIKCNDYLSWISEKKRELQARDPGYKSIEKYQKYFHIHNNCNYPWLLKDTPDITCQRITRTRAGEQNGKGKPLGDVSPTFPVLTKGSVQIIKKDPPSLAQPSSKGKGDPMSGKPPMKGSEKAPTQITSSPDTNVNPQSNIPSVILQGSPVVEAVPIFQPIPDSHPNPDDEYLKLQELFYSHRNNLDGHKITQDMHERIYTKPVIFPKTYPTYIHNNPFVSTLTKGYNYIPPTYTRTKHYPATYTHILPFQKAISTASQFTQNRKPWKTDASFFHQEYPPFSSTIKGIIKNY